MRKSTEPVPTVFFNHLKKIRRYVTVATGSLLIHSVSNLTVCRLETVENINVCALLLILDTFGLFHAGLIIKTSTGNCFLFTFSFD